MGDIGNRREGRSDRVERFDIARRVGGRGRRRRRLEGDDVGEEGCEEEEDEDESTGGTEGQFLDSGREWKGVT